MLFTTLLFAGLSAAAAIAIPAKSSLPYPEAPFKWHAPAHMGNITFHGTHREIQAQIKALNSTAWQFNATHRAHLDHASKAEIDEHLALIKKYGNATGTHLEARSNRYTQYCFQPQYAAAMFDVSTSNYEYIYNHFGTGMCETVPRSCSRFSCSYDDSIVMCNDEATPAIIPCSTLAQNAAFITNTCRHFDNQGHQIGNDCEGQAFYHNPNYNVLVKQVDVGKYVKFPILNE